MWLSPVQARVLPVSSEHEAYAARVAGHLQGLGLRVEVVEASESLGKRIARARQDRLPYWLVVGGDDEEAGTVGVSSRDQPQPERGVPLEQFGTRLVDEAVPGH